MPATTAQKALCEVCEVYSYISLIIMYLFLLVFSYLLRVRIEKDLKTSQVYKKQHPVKKKPCEVSENLENDLFWKKGLFSLLLCGFSAAKSLRSLCEVL
jgi:biopolymer transport protein ExbD